MRELWQALEMSLRPTQGDETPSLQQPPSMEALALPFVIPSAAEGSAVLSQPATAFHGSARPPLCHPERSRGICSSLNQQPPSMEALALPFVIPSAAEGSAVLSTSNRSPWKRHPPLCHPERTRISCHAAPDTIACAPFSKERRMEFANATKFYRKSGAAEGSAVQRTFHGNVFRRRSAGCPEVHGLSESARSKNMVAAPYPPAEQVISCFTGGGSSRNRCPVAFACC